MKSNLFLLVFGFLFVSSVSAQGLTLVNDTFQINKSSGVDQEITLRLLNEEGFTFYNISFESNSVISMEKIPQLTSGQTATFTGKITSNIDFSGEVRIKGAYQSQTGSQAPQTKDISITYDSLSGDYSLDKCQITIIRGDSVKWTNNGDTSIKMIRSPTDVPVPNADIAINGSFTKLFDEIQSFKYYFAIASFPITPICTVTVLDNQGLVNDPNLDAILKLNLDVVSDPTTISLSVPQTAYTINFANEDGGALTITNTGTKKAEAVRLSAEWFSFSENGFDLTPGQTKGVSYTIRPPTTLTTEDTNKTYKINLTISGNFDKKIQEFSVFIPYTSIDSGGLSSNRCDNFDQDCLQYFNDVFCPAHPTSFLCNQEPIIETIYVNNVSDAEFNATFKGKNVLDLFRSVTKLEDRMDSLFNVIKEKEALDSEYKNATVLKDANQTSIIAESRDNEQRLTNTLWMVIIGGLTAIIAMGGFWLAWRFKQKNITKKQEVW